MEFNMKEHQRDVAKDGYDNNNIHAMGWDV